jgi:hypothetical protein
MKSFEKFGVRNDVEINLLFSFVQFFLDDRFDFVCSANGDGGFVDNDPVLAHVLADRFCDGENVLQVCRAVFVGRCADRDKLKKTVINTFGDVGRELESSGFAVAFQVVVQARFVDRHVSRVQAVDLVLVDIDADNVIAGLGHARTGHQTDITGTENRQFHRK